MNDCDDIVKEFLVESHENLDRLDRDLVALEKQPSDREILASIFRTIHTIKGTSGFLGFGKLEAVTHVGESLLAKLRDGQLGLSPELTTALLAMVDAVRQMLAAIEAGGSEGERDDGELIATLTRLLEPAAAAASAAPETTEAKSAASGPVATEQPAAQASPLPSVAEQDSPSRAAAAPVPPAPEAANLGDIFIRRGMATEGEVSRAVAEQSTGETSS
jgi:two-component system, chemotaxis family, sensor kinase CheA